MADNLTTTPILSLYATTGERVKELSIKNGQLIFVHDLHRIALDFNGKRTFYNQIEELNTEQERASILAPVSGRYYFVIETAVLWTYQSEWIQITTRPEDIIFVGSELPELGVAKKLYINNTDGNENISIWDEGSSEYKVVADKTQEVTDDDILSLFE